jgi:hypothetical protein
MTKQQALDKLIGVGDRPHSEINQIVMVAHEHGATPDEIADRLGITSDALLMTYPDAISEAGRLGHFRHPHGGPAIS